jgi:uncharacterized membrane protein
MGCITMGWFEHVLIEIVIVVAIVAILKLFLPWFLNQVGVNGGIVVSILNIIIWAIVLIFVIVIIFTLLSCVSFGHVLR